MILKHFRRQQTTESVIGEIYIDSPRECFTLEDAKTLYPDGEYSIALYASPRNKRMVALLLNVPGHTYIEIHIGNSAKDVEGCVAVGTSRSPNWIGNSELAFLRLINKIHIAIQGGEQVLIQTKTELFPD
jgi:hypothetical protein